MAIGSWGSIQKGERHEDSFVDRSCSAFAGCGAGDGILLLDEQRFAQQPGRHARRAGDITAHTHHAARRESIQQPERLHQGQQQEPGAHCLVQD